VPVWLRPNRQPGWLLGVGCGDGPKVGYITRRLFHDQFSEEIVILRISRLIRDLFSIPPMATANSEGPCLAVRPRKDRSGWYVEVWWLKRPLEQIGHFHTQGEARKWIEFEATSHFVLREIESMIRHRGGSGAMPSAPDGPPLSLRPPASEAAI
jgi:hypothetical protein